MQWKLGHDVSGGGGYCSCVSDGGRSSDGTAKAKGHNEEHAMMQMAKLNHNSLTREDTIVFAVAL